MDLEKIKLRLKSLGYETTVEDEFALNFVMDSVEQYIKHFCNIKEIPDCLECVFVDMCCGRFLKDKKSTGQLSTIEFDEVVKQIIDGDTTVSFQAGTDNETIFNSYIDKLINGYTDSLLAHRKLLW